MNPLKELTEKYYSARQRMLNAELLFKLEMKSVAAEAHAAGITRYMAQKATGAPQSEVAAWFGDLPTSKPGRRRKDDPIYGGVQ